MLFWKMNGLGNDYIFIDIDNLSEKELIGIERNLKRLIPALCDRHFGVGGDGVVILYPSSVADVRMRMYNADGSEGRMCGNAVRCIAKYLIESGKRNDGSMAIETLSGVVNVNAECAFGRVETVRVDMGCADIIAEEDNAIYVNIGNPHAVILSSSLGDEEIASAVKLSQKRDVNVELVKIITEHSIEMRVCERGSGETLACGTGASAATYALIARGLVKSPVDVLMRGGELKIEYLDGHIYMNGRTDLNYIGELKISDYGQD